MAYEDNNKVISLLTKKDPVNIKNYEVGKVYACYAGSLFYYCDVTDAAYELEDYDGERKEIPAGSYLYTSEVVGIEDDKHIPLFSDASILFVKYLGDNIFEDIQSKAKIAPISILPNHSYPLAKEKADEFNDCIKDNQMFYDHLALERVEGKRAEDVIDDTFIVFDINTLDENFNNQVKMLYDELVLSDEHLCLERKDIIERMQKNGLRIPELTLQSKNSKVTREVQMVAEVDNFIYDQNNKSK